MALTALAPAVAALGALLLLPVVAHFTRQVPRERQAFGAMLLLRRVVKRLRRRRRLKDPLLLLLRLAMLACVVLAGVGPELHTVGDKPLFGGTGRVVVVIDRSMSMSLVEAGSSLASRAVSEAARVVDGLPDGTQVAVIAYADAAERLTPELSTDIDRVQSRIRSIEPGLGGSNLRGALLEARRVLGEEAGEVLVFSDEAGPTQIQGASQEIQRLVESGSAVVPMPIVADPPRNISIVSALYGDGLEGGEISVRVSNFGPAPVEASCDVTLPDGRTIPVFVSVPGAGHDASGKPVAGLAEERVTVPAEVEGGVGKVDCEDGALAADDARWFHLPRVGASRVLVVDGDPGATPTRSEVYFLERALAPWGTQQSGVRPDVTTPLGLLHLDPEKHRVVFVANLADPLPYGPMLTEFVRKGGNLVITAGDNLAPDRYNAALGSVLPAPIRAPRNVGDDGATGAPLMLPDTSLRLFAPFSRAGRAGFGRVRTMRLLTFDPFVESEDTKTLLRFEGGLPALVDRKVGLGHVLVWTSTVDVAWTNFPLQSVFMPLMQHLVTWLGGDSGGAAARLSVTVGETLRIPLPELATEPSVFGADGQAVRSRIEKTELVFTPERPGAYEVRVDSAPPLAYVAANVGAAESDVMRYDTIAKIETAIRPDLFTRRTDLGPWLLAAALLFALLQAVAGARRVADTPEMEVA
jgi:hypothetical protein